MSSKTGRGNARYFHFSHQQVGKHWQGLLRFKGLVLHFFLIICLKKCPNRAPLYRKILTMSCKLLGKLLECVQKKANEKNRRERCNYELTHSCPRAPLHSLINSICHSLARPHLPSLSPVGCSCSWLYDGILPRWQIHLFPKLLSTHAIKP